MRVRVSSVALSEVYFLFSQLWIDCCSGGSTNDPDGTFYAILNRQDLEQESYYYTAIRDYVSVRTVILNDKFCCGGLILTRDALVVTLQCTTEDPFSIIRDYQVEIVSTHRVALRTTPHCSIILSHDRSFAFHRRLPGQQ